MEVANWSQAEVGYTENTDPGRGDDPACFPNGHATPPSSKNTGGRERLGLLHGSDMTDSTRPVSSEYTYHAPYKQTGPKQVHHYLWPIVLHEVDGMLEAGSRALDVGCGNGALCKILADRYKVYGVDLSESGITLAKESAPTCHFQVASVYDDLRETFGITFDAVVSLETIEHLYSPRDFFKRIREALVSEGLLVLSTPYHGYTKNLAIAVSGKCDKHFNPLVKGGHIKFFSKNTLTKLLEEFGFKLTRWKGVGRFPLFWKSMITVARKID